ncbi:MAG: FMN-binding protein [Oscillospiraceae bacterium]|nr:FMN-binding protein [Oscillospiraceae bacterium]
MVTASLLRRRSRMLIALLSIAIGACILSGLLTIYIDVPRQMSAQFSGYGANMILLSDGEAALTQTAANRALDMIPAEDVVGASPYRYVRVDMVKRQQSFTAAGTDFEQVQKTSPYFRVEGSYPTGSREVLLGKEVASTIGAKVGSVIELTWTAQTTAPNTATTAAELIPGAVLTGSADGYVTGSTVTASVTIGADGTIAALTIDTANETEGFGQRCMEPEFTDRFIGQHIPVAYDDGVDALSGATITSNAVLQAINTAHASAQVSSKTLKFTVTGLLDTGGDEETYIYMSLADMAALTGDSETLDVMELRVQQSADELALLGDTITGTENGVSARLIKRVAKSEASVLSKLQFLVFLVTVVVLVLTMVSVSTTMTAVISERRKEIGLRKALGAPDRSIRIEFLGEGLFLGLLGGVLGGLLGFAFAQFVSIRVFESSIAFQPLLLPAAVLLSMAIAALSCLRPIAKAVAIDPALVLKGE